jgi:DNA-binding response OmpR family regulator
MKNVLVVEDDLQIAELVELHLRDIHCETKIVETGKSALYQASIKQFDLIILDLMLPDINGIEICQTLRAQRIMTPIIMLTARSEEIDKIVGLESGADDYLTKPFSVRELMARAKVLFRRAEMDGKNNAEEIEEMVFGDLAMNVAKRKVTLKDKKIDLTPKEFDLLQLFMSHPGKSYSREALLNKIWGYEFSGYEHTVNSHINRLRTKIETDLTQPQYILTTWGVGYRFNDDWK